MSQLLSGAQMEAILSAFSIRHQHSSALVHLKHVDVTQLNLQPPKEEDNAEKLEKKVTKEKYKK